MTLARLRAAAVAACLAVLALAGCVHVPTAGPVRPAPVITGDDEQLLLQFTPEGPRPGASELAIVAGFFGAMLAYPANHAIAREFLTEDAALEWRPDTGTTIYADTPTYSVEDPGQVRVVAEVVGHLDARGTWSAVDGRPRAVYGLELVREDGEWRISEPPEGLFLSQLYFDRYYDAYALYFFDPGARILVPDLVHLPEGEQTATLLVGALARGPTSWLSGAVESFVPPAAAPPLPVVVDESGVAQVPLEAVGEGLTSAEQERLLAQLAWTLRQVPEVQALEVAVDGTPVRPPDADGDPRPVDVDVGEEFDPADSAASSKLFATSGDRLFDVAGEAVLPVPGPFGSGAVPVERFAVDRSGRIAAVVTGGRSRVLVGALAQAPDRPEPVLRGGHALLRPQWDFSGLLWVVDRTDDGPVVRLLGESGWERAVLAPRTPAALRAFSLARDGVRIAAIAGRGARSRLLVGRVVRPADRSPQVRVGRWREVATRDLRLRGFRDVAWASPTELAVVAREGDGVPQLYTVRIDGSEATPTSLLAKEVVSVAASSTQTLPTVVGTADGTLWAQRVDRWEQLVERRLTQPSYVE